MPRGRSLLVTGAGRGIGAAIAQRAVAQGYQVGVIDITSGGVPVDGIAEYVGSITDEPFIESVLASFGTPDVVVNNAGIVRFGPLIDMSTADFRAVVDVNLAGTFMVSRAAARRWISEGRPGCIVSITSMNGVAAGPNSGAYGPTKAAVALLTSQMAIEWGPHGIRANAVAPGLIDAGMSAPIFADPVMRAARESKVPSGRLGTANDVASVVLFLASDDAAYINGQNILVDGGVTGSVIAGLPRPAAVDSIGSR